MERNGLEWGGTGAEARKDAIDDMFTVNNGPFKMVDNAYNVKLVNFTADGVSVNFGKNSVFLRRLDDERGWLIKIHCASHWTELAIKDAFNYM